VYLREGLPMSSKLSRAPFATTCDGGVFLNVTAFDVPAEAHTIFEVALSEPGRLFVGVRLSPGELAAARERQSHGLEEAAAFAAGRRQRRRKRRLR
jgi:hypothetical protein